MRKFTFEEVYQAFISKDCKLISTEYIDIKLPLEFICKCGKRTTASFDNFKRNKYCSDCGIIKQVKSQRHTFGYIANYFEEKNCKLLSTTYVNNKQKLDYICCCGNKSSIAFNDFQSGKRCWQCKGKRSNKDRVLTLEYVSNYFKEQNCILLSDSYDNAREPLEYICGCGTISKIAFYKFQSGQRCFNCKSKKISIKLVGHYAPRGKDSPSWNPDLTDEERKIKRNYPEYRKWTKAVLMRDNYTCQHCLKRGNGNLNAHHLDGYNWCKEKRVDIDNGITLCDKCHKGFHDTFGWKDNTKEQWVEYNQLVIK
ncbi:HNH endonuclease [Paenibacillus medicaginis]|uniref:HNH endonuclease n=1 Tax=Paenibacillus medicaginis TaxID=1470560 RepID=A0ABV5BUZ5_9BACL